MRYKVVLDTGFPDFHDILGGNTEVPLGVFDSSREIKGTPGLILKIRTSDGLLPFTQTYVLGDVIQVSVPAESEYDKASEISRSRSYVEARIKDVLDSLEDKRKRGDRK
jgi:hypothetical protein